MKTMFRILGAVLTAHFATLVCAQTVTIGLTALPAPEGFLFHKDKTMVVELSAAKPKLILVLLPGGNGVLGFNKLEGKPQQIFDKTNFKSQFNGRFTDILKDIIDPNGINLPIEALVVDSPYPLEETVHQADFGFPKDRDASEHQQRLLSVLDHYKQVGVPIWLFGHSNGTFSATRFMGTLKSMKREGDVAGLILSSSRDVILPQNIPDVPTLFAHSDRDGCDRTPFAKAQQNFLGVKARNKSDTEFVVIKGGKEQPGNPCFTGIHMHNGAYEEVAQAVSEFLKKNAGL